MHLCVIELHAVRPPLVKCSVSNVCPFLYVTSVQSKPIDVLEICKGRSTETCPWWTVQSLILATWERVVILHAIIQSAPWKLLDGVGNRVYTLQSQGCMRHIVVQDVLWCRKEELRNGFNNYLV